jgi:hypothetical protein
MLMRDETGKYATRTFEDGDETALVNLFEKAYKNYGGYARETPESWRWCCLERPDVEKKGIIVALDQRNGNVVGYAVAGKSGNLWEIAYNLEEDGRKIVSLLLDNAVAYLQNAGASSINLNAPREDQIVKQVCMERGFALGSTPQMFLSILNFEELIALLAKDNESKLKSKYHETILIKTKDAPFWIKDTILLQVNRDGVKVDTAPQPYSIRIEADYVTFSSLIFRNISPFRAYISSRLKIEPFRKVPTALKLLSYLRVGSKWSYQLSEYG